MFVHCSQIGLREVELTLCHFWLAMLGLTGGYRRHKHPYKQSRLRIVVFSISNLNFLTIIITHFSNFSELVVCGEASAFINFQKGKRFLQFLLQCLYVFQYVFF